MYKPDHFELYEWFPKSFLKANKQMGDNLWQLIDDRVLLTADWLREKYGKILMNDYKWEGRNQYRGFRPFNCKIGAKFSQHKFGRAGDLIFVEEDVEKVRQDILKSDDNVFQFITAIEMDVPWLHFDVRNWDKEKHGILIIHP